MTAGMIRATPATAQLRSGLRVRDRDRGAPVRIDAATLVTRFENAGATLLALSVRGYSTALRQSRFDVVRSALDAYGYQPERVRLPPPEAAAITAMDEAYGWLSAIAEDRYLLRRIIGARSLVHPITLRHLFPWRRLGVAIGADHRAVQRWHAEGIGLILADLNGR